MYRDKIIEDLVVRYRQYLEHQEDNTLHYLYEDPKLIVEPKDDITLVIEKVEEQHKQVEHMLAVDIKAAYSKSSYDDDTKESYFCAGAEHAFKIALDLLENA